ncbi:DUF481 domain-containing protein [Anaeromyxobacter oryzisoli]|uniref:DUF481 domain-containing protein n=1 Tax=Anaeromyxobacter oryzisoli TaxID=2925408 RepID=UPI001F59B036|nr:DUF481 domain-containing protein [Anaeromyxobacter sp. SG63]
MRTVAWVACVVPALVAAEVPVSDAPATPIAPPTPASTETTSTETASTETASTETASTETSTATPTPIPAPLLTPILTLTLTPTPILTPMPAPVCPAPPAPAEPGERKPAGWTGALGAGAILLTGNTSTLTTSGTASVQRDVVGWIFSAKGSGVYGRTRPVDRTQPSQVVALAATSQLRLDRKLGAHLTVFALGGSDTDHVASVEYRAYGEGGLAVIWLDAKRANGTDLSLRTDLGFRYAHESRWQYYATAAAPVTGRLPAVDTSAPRAGLAFRSGLSKDVALVEEAEALANVEGRERYNLRSLSKLTSRLVGKLTFVASYLVAHDSRPAPGKVRTDTSLGGSIEVAF